MKRETVCEIVGGVLFWVLVVVWCVLGCFAFD